MRGQLHPLALRIWHWGNAAMIIVLMITGALLRISEPKILFGYSSAVLIHKYAGYAVAASFLFWLVYCGVTGSLSRYYVIRSEDLKGMPKQAKFYLFGIFKGSENPFHPTLQEKFNPLQKVAYVFTMCVFTPAVIISGILFSNILFFRSVIDLMGGLRVLDAVHVIAAYAVAVYLVVHLYMSTLGKTPLTHIKEMLTGDEDHVEGVGSRSTTRTAG
jgi:thiosulfate reductase cytochrome b subunit